MADKSQWNNLQMENQDYKHSRYCQCVDKYAVLYEVLEEETATGSQAHSSAVPPAQIMRQYRAHSVRSMSFSNLGDATYVIESDFGIEQGSKLAGKKPSSSQGGTSSVQGSRGSKSSKSLDNNPFVECATSLTNYTSAKLKIRDRWESEFEKFYVTMGTQVVESFAEVHPGRKVTALLNLRDAKWRKTFLYSIRQLQEYWLNSLEIARQNDNGGQPSQTNASP